MVTLEKMSLMSCNVFIRAQVFCVLCEMSSFDENIVEKLNVGARKKKRRGRKSTNERHLKYVLKILIN